MKKTLTALAMATITCYGVHAQKLQKAGEVTSHKTATKTASKVKQKRQRKPETPQNFEICRGNSGYFVCNETPGTYNSTHPSVTIKERHIPRISYAYHRNYSYAELHPQKGEPVAPSSLSYPEHTNTIPGVSDYPYNVPHYIVLGPFDE